MAGPALHRLCIVQAVMKRYRVPFFETLSERLGAQGIALEVVYGEPWAAIAGAGDNADLPPPLGRKVAGRMLLGKLHLTPALGPLLAADAVIVEHANKHLINYPLALRNALGGTPLGLWGHGRDLQADPASAGERFKRRTLHWADWWFAYTKGAAAYVEGQGFPRDRITAVGNAIDTRALSADLASIDAAERQRAIADLGLDPAAASRLIYCGRLYPEKGVEQLIAAADELQSLRPGTELLIVGAGPLSSMVEAAAASRPWLRALGPRFGRDKALCLSLADVMVNPGLVGLNILDAFAAGLPMVTTDIPIHSPEIEYLRDGENGLVTPPATGDLAHAIAGLLDDPPRLAAMAQSALADSHEFTIERMADNFAAGVSRWLGPKTAQESR